MEKKITFQSMEHSAPLEAHANQKLEKIITFLKEDEIKTPIFLEMWLKGTKIHANYAVEINLKTPQFDIKSHDEGTDIYVLVDNTVDKLVKQYLKMRKKENDKKKRVDTPKKEFASDKYTLGDD